MGGGESGGGWGGGWEGRRGRGRFKLMSWGPGKVEAEAE